MSYKCNGSKCNGMLALIRCSDALYLLVPKQYFYFAYMPPPGYKPPPSLSPHKTPYDVIWPQGFNAAF